MKMKMINVRNGLTTMAAGGALFASALTASAQIADLRVVHASPDAPAVDVLVNDAVVFADAPFTGVTPYAQLRGDTYNIKVNAAGTSQTVIDVDLPVDNDVDYSVVAVNELANIEPQVLIDDNTIDLDNARVRFFHASPNAPAVDIAVKDGPVLFGDIEYREVGDYIPVAPGEYDLEVRVAGTNDVVLELPDTMLEGATVYTVYAMGLVGGDPALQAVISVDNAVGDVQFSQVFPGIAGQTNGIRLTGATPGDRYAFVYGLERGEEDVPGCDDLEVDIEDPLLVGTATADALGEVTLVRSVAPALSGRMILLQAVNLTTCEKTDVEELMFQ